MHRLEGLRDFITRQEIKGIKKVELRQDQLERNNALFQLWNGYREPDNWKHPIQEDLAAMLEEVNFNVDVLSQQRVRAMTEKEGLVFREQHSIPEKTRIKGEVFSHDGSGNSWLHAMDWVLANDKANIMYRIARRPRSTVDFDNTLEQPERYYSFGTKRSGVGGEKIWKYRRFKDGRQEELPEILPEDRDVLAAIYLVPDIGSEKGDTFWHKDNPYIARPSSKSSYSNYSFYGTWESCGGTLHIKTNDIENKIKSSSYENYLHVYMLER